MNSLTLTLYTLAALSASLAAPSGLYGSYHGPQAVPHVLPSGHLADTHEVAVAKEKHYTAVAEAKAHGGSYGDYAGGYGHGGSYGGYAGGYGHGGSYGGYAGSYGHGAAAYSGAAYGAHSDYRYHGPIAIPHVLHDGHIADTHEVAAAKAGHYAAVAKARAHGGYNHGGDYSGQYASGYDHYPGAYLGYGTHAAYHGPIAKPVVLPSGYLADTHDVAVAKGHHLHALAQAKHHYGPQHYYH